MRRQDLIGQQFSRLTVIEAAGSAKNGNARWRCRCRCGQVIVVNGYRLRKGLTTSCGCYRREYMQQAIKANPKMRAQMGQHRQFQASEGVNLAAVTKLRATNRSGVVGVSFDRQTAKWRARLFIKGQLVLNKQYISFDDAVSARQAAEREYLGPILRRLRQKSADDKR